MINALVEVSLLTQETIFSVDKGNDGKSNLDPRIKIRWNVGRSAILIRNVQIDDRPRPKIQFGRTAGHKWNSSLY